MTFFSFLIKNPGLISSQKENMSQLLLDMSESPASWHLHSEAIVTALSYQECDNWSLSIQMTNRWTVYTAWILRARSSFLPQENMGGYNAIMLLRTVHNLKLTFISRIFYLMLSDHMWYRRGSQLYQYLEYCIFYLFIVCLSSWEYKVGKGRSG